ncbi:MAG TPA: acyl-protein synthetase [Rhodocyclaceae bacterium]|nr:acyl-protein synthetase [Rhodocyclaceae bacterium]
MKPKPKPPIMPPPDTARDRLVERIKVMIAAGVDGDPAPFDRLALDLFAWQYANNGPYRVFCDGKSATPATVTDWREIPAFPTDAFKTGIVTSFPFEQAVMAQLTSGTTANRRGQIFRDAIGRELVLSANRVMTAAWLFPDFAQGQRCRILILAPSPEMAPSMGMAIGMEETRKHFGTSDSRFLLDWSGLDIRALLQAFADAEGSGVPLAMIGSTSAFVFLFNSCRARGLSFRLPAGSRIGDGGGYRGKFGELSQEDFYRLAEEVLGIPASHCVNVLGMAESATNYFDNTLRAARRPSPDAALQTPSAAGLAAPAPQGFSAVTKNPARRRFPPPWARTVAVDRVSLTALPPGEVGLLRHYDLINVPTVLAVQTDNLGYVNADGSFQIVGRARQENGRVAELPSERVVGPMGDKRIFRFLESYVNFSIRFKMGWLGKPKRSAPAAAATPMTPPVCPCDELSEEMLSETGRHDDAAANRRD